MNRRRWRILKVYLLRENLNTQNLRSGFRIQVCTSPRVCQNRTDILCTILGKINPGERLKYPKANILENHTKQSGPIFLCDPLDPKKGFWTIHHQIKQKNLQHYELERWRRSNLCNITVSTLWRHSFSNLSTRKREANFSSHVL